jgi:hypothetical protein
MACVSLRNEEKLNTSYKEMYKVELTTTMIKK